MVLSDYEICCALCEFTVKYNVASWKIINHETFFMLFIYAEKYPKGDNIGFAKFEKGCTKDDIEHRIISLCVSSEYCGFRQFA